jgi:hypothetical protein
MDDVQPVADKIVQVKGTVLRVAKRENDGVTLPNWFAEVKDKESG